MAGSGGQVTGKPPHSLTLYSSPRFPTVKNVWFKKRSLCSDWQRTNSQSLENALFQLCFRHLSCPRLNMRLLFWQRREIDFAVMKVSMTGGFHKAANLQKTFHTLSSLFWQQRNGKQLFWIESSRKYLSEAINNSKWPFLGRWNEDVPKKSVSRN